MDIDKVLELCMNVRNLDKEDAATLKAVQEAEQEVRNMLHSYILVPPPFETRQTRQVLWREMSEKAQREAQARLQVLKNNTRMAEIRSAVQEANGLLKTWGKSTNERISNESMKEVEKRVGDIVEKLGGRKRKAEEITN